MANLIRNSFPQAQVTAANTALSTLEGIYEPNAPSLTPDQRKTSPKINVSNKAFVEDALNVLDLPAAAAFIPSYINRADMQIDLTTFEQVDAVLVRLMRLVSILEDYRIAAGSEAYSTGLMVKKMADVATLAGINGASEISRKLGERFEGQGGPGTDNPPNT